MSLNNSSKLPIMNVLILCGGKGTRMNPFTLSKPKPLIRLLSIPLLDYLIYKLKSLGNINIIILAISNNNIMNDIINYATEASLRFNIKIICNIEYGELGTGGPIKNAESLITSEDFLVMNSDIIFEENINKLINEHINNKNIITILATKVENPKRFGVLKTKKNKVIEFIEKPDFNAGNLINAGIYVLNKRIFKNIELKEISIEKEIFPFLVKKNEVGFSILNGYWKDVGKPIDYFEAQKYIINNSNKFNIPFIYNNIKQTKNKINYFINPTVNISEKCIIKNNVSIGRDCFIGENVLLESCTIMDGTIIKDNTIIKNTIIGNKCIINSNSELDGCLIGDNSIIEGKHHYVIITLNKCELVNT